MSPPGVTSSNRTSAAVDRREWKAARRDVLVQCERCGCTGTARVNGRGRMVSTNLRAIVGRVWRHHECGGALRCFDLEGAR